MKNIIKIVLYSFTAVVGLSACTKDFEKLNTPPTSVTTIDPALVFSRVLKDGTFAEGGELPNNKFGSWIQHWAGGPVVPVSRYLESSEDAIWEQHYSLIRDLKQISYEAERERRLTHPAAPNWPLQRSMKSVSGNA